MCGDLLYRKIPIISPGLIFVQKAFFFGELIYEVLIFGGAYYWNEFCVSKWVGLDDKNSLKHKDNGLKQLKTVNTTHPWAYIEMGGGGGYLNFWRGFLIGILWYI